MVRTASVLCRARYAMRQKEVFKKKGNYVIHQTPTRVTSYLEAFGTEPVAAREYLSPRYKEWNPPEELLPDFRIKQILPDKPKVQTGQTPIWHLSDRIAFTEGIDQACLLTKTQRFNGLPSQIEQLVGQYSIPNQDDVVRDVIRHSQQWDNAKEKLPKRRDLANLSWKFAREYGISDSRSANILLNSFLRYCQTLSGTFPELTGGRRLLLKPSLETFYEFKGETIQILAVNEFMLLGRRLLTPFGDKNLIDQSVNHKLLDLHPINPTIDLLKMDRYSLKNDGALNDLSRHECSHPQIVFRINGGNRHPLKNQAYNLMNTFGIAITEARNRFGPATGDVLTPITVININISYRTLNFLIFQLNTLDFTSENGIKNFAWFDTVQLFNKIKCQPWLELDKKMKPPKYEDYNSDGFKKFLALYLYDYAQNH